MSHITLAAVLRADCRGTREGFGATRILSLPVIGVVAWTRVWGSGRQKSGQIPDIFKKMKLMGWVDHGVTD